MVQSLLTIKVVLMWVFTEAHLRFGAKVSVRVEPTRVLPPVEEIWPLPFVIFAEACTPSFTFTSTTGGSQRDDGEILSLSILSISARLVTSTLRQSLMASAYRVGIYCGSHPNAAAQCWLASDRHWTCSWARNTATVVKMANKFDELLSTLGTGKWNLLFFFATTYWNMQLVPHTLGSVFLAPQVQYTCEPPGYGDATQLYNTT
ncbi:hypothetical protein C7M84_024467 [Penaeus vannamei]|uniref:Secreted protein n=1 Tax=Penaeus vannamei TaxID=6689 RepID=A0A3R7NB65_PENVA|nr:hypothetical protein C7M84_024467 [Penaeus vannamei]